MVYKPAIHFNVIHGISAAALRGWAISGRLDHIRTPGGKRLYSVQGVSTLLGIDDSHSPNEKQGYIYARVSNTNQQPDLERQIIHLQEAYPGHVLIKDVAPGINFKRQGLRTLLDRALRGMVSEVVVMHRDRLARFGYDLLEFVFKKAGTRLLVHGANEDVEGEHDLADDLLAVTTLFVASHQGRRAATNRKKKREEAGFSGGKGIETAKGGSSKRREKKPHQ